MDFILQRAKAFVGAVGAGSVPVVIVAFEKSFGFDVPTSWEVWILTAVTGLIVHQVPNKKV